MTDRSDSSHIETQIFNDALNGVAVPDCVNLEAHELPFWKAITDARANWNTIDLIHAANLARCMAAIEDNTKELKREGEVLVNARGTSVMNPRHTILEQLSRRSAALSTKIHVHAAATQGEAKLGRGKNAKKQQSVDALELVGDDDLIAKPLH